MERKYFFEAGLNTFTSFKTIIPIEHLKELSEYDNHEYHIYGILAYNKMYFKKERTKVTENGIEICLFTIIDLQEIEYPIPLCEIGKDLDYSKVELVLSFPYTFLELKINDSTFLSAHPEIKNSEITINAQDFFNLNAETLVTKQEFEVLYIGQSYGHNGKRTAFDRLASHSTLQKILTEHQSKQPNKHIYILLLEITTNLAMSFDGLSKCYTKSHKESDQHMVGIVSNPPKEQQAINITEAALIHYFKPTYNINFVENFPNENHKGYKQYFDLDYNSLVVEIDLVFDNSPIIQLYTSSNRINSSFEFIKYKLYKDNNRLSIYNIFKK